MESSLTRSRKRNSVVIRKQWHSISTALVTGWTLPWKKSPKDERMKTELITNVSHDLKTPLTSIINYIDLLKRLNLKDPEALKYLEILDSKAHRLKSLTEDVVEASKASTGNLSLEMTELNFVEMLYQVMGEFEERMENRHLTLMTHLPDSPAMIYADGRRMWRIH